MDGGKKRQDGEMDGLRRRMKVKVKDGEGSVE